MTSKYDQFWAERTSEILKMIEESANGRLSSFRVDEIQSLGARKSWYGKAKIIGKQVLDSPMAHLRSLAHLVARSSAGESWEGLELELKVSSDFVLSAEFPSQMVVKSRLNQSTQLPQTRMEPKEFLLPNSVLPLDVSAACNEAHKILLKLPFYKSPKDVPFKDGLYFFYEAGESAGHDSGNRVVRVGNHPRKEGRLVARLKEHFRGTKNGSVFRRYIGGALIRKENPNSECIKPSPGKGHWEKQDSKTCPNCATIENKVSHHISDKMHIRCVYIPDRSERNRFEKLLIATLAGCKNCRPSAKWLGGYSYSYKVRECGLWNSEFVGGKTMSTQDIQRLVQLVDRSYTTRNEKTPSSSSRLDIHRTRNRKMQLNHGSIRDMDGNKKPIVIIQCASKKNPGAMNFEWEGKLVKFVGQPNLASMSGEVIFAKPDDLHPDGKRTWRDMVVGINEDEDARNQFVSAGRLYNNPAYGRLLEVFGEQHLYILSAGWGLVRSSYLLPDYDITFSYRKGQKYKQRFSKDSYRDFNHIQDDYGSTCNLPIFLFSGKDYRPLFTSLMEKVEASKSKFIRAPQNLDVKINSLGSYNRDNGFHDLPYPTSTLTNWHYQCAEAFAAHYQIPTI